MKLGTVTVCGPAPRLLASVAWNVQVATPLAPDGLTGTLPQPPMVWARSLTKVTFPVAVEPGPTGVAVKGTVGLQNGLPGADGGILVDVTVMFTAEAVRFRLLPELFAVR